MMSDQTDFWAVHEGVGAAEEQARARNRGAKMRDQRIEVVHTHTHTGIDPMDEFKVSFERDVSDLDYDCLRTSSASREMSQRRPRMYTREGSDRGTGDSYSSAHTNFLVNW